MTDKTLKHFFEVYKPKAPDEQKFVDKHVTIKHQDRNGNGDDVFKGNTKYIKRKEERKGYDVGEDEKVYEENELDEDVGAQIAELMRKKNAATSPIARKNIESQIAKLKRQKTKSMTAYNEEAEQIDETAKVVAHLQKRYGDNIRKSHVRSAASDFGVDASKLAKAVRAKLGKDMLDEEEQIDELSHDTLRRYRMKSKSIGDNEKGDINYRAKGRELAGRKTYGGRMAGIEKAKVMAKEENDMPFEGPYRNTSEPRKDKYGNTIKNAAKHLAKKAMNSQKNEEVESIDEISATTKDAYAQKAGKQLPGLFKKSGESADAARKYYNRKNTVRKIANEEVELEEGTMRLSKVHVVHHHDHPAAKEFAKNYTAAMKGDHKEGGPNDADMKASDAFHQRYSGMRTREGFAGSGTHVYHDHKTGAKWKVDRHPNGKTFYGTDHIISHHTDPMHESFDLEEGEVLDTVAEDRVIRSLVAYYEELGEDVLIDDIVAIAEEMIDELSKGTLGSYVNKAATKIGDQGITAGLKIANDEKSEKNFKTMGKRQKGIATAVKKMTKEDVISRAVEKYSPSEEERTPLDEQLVARIEDMQESHIHLILNLFEQLDESNQRNLMDMIDQGRINEVLDFAISAVRGE
jgi:hypothetical protein